MDWVVEWQGEGGGNGWARPAEIVNQLVSVGDVGGWEAGNVTDRVSDAEMNE